MQCKSLNVTQKIPVNTITQNYKIKFTVINLFTSSTCGFDMNSHYICHR